MVTATTPFSWLCAWRDNRRDLDLLVVRARTAIVQNIVIQTEAACCLCSAFCSKFGVLCCYEGRDTVKSHRLSLSSRFLYCAVIRGTRYNRPEAVSYTRRKLVLEASKHSRVKKTNVSTQNRKRTIDPVVQESMVYNGTTVQRNCGGVDGE